MPQAAAPATITATATALVAALQSGRTRATSLLDQALDRIHQFDGEINAMVLVDEPGARAAAIAADAALARGERLPLLGVPMTIKEAINLAGAATTWGLPGTQQIAVREDAVVVQRLKAAGAVIVGKTNVSTELADWQSSNAVYGTTRNPWRTTLTPGGSSGGSAAALAAGYVPLELGTDIGGSLRVPAHFCGVYAHKPSHGLVPMRGVAPPGTPALVTASPVDFAVVGPMARSADDLALALDVIAGPDVLAATAYRLELPPPRHRRLADYRVLVLDEHPLVPTARAAQQAVQRCADRLANAGCQLSRHSPLLPDLAAIAQSFSTLLMAFFGAAMPEPAWRGLQQAVAQLPADARSDAAMVQRALVLSHRDWLQADRRRAQLAQQWRALFDTVDVVLCPVSATPAFAHDHSAPRGRRLRVDAHDIDYDRQALWTSLPAIGGLPTTVVPAGLSDDGLPVGVQLIGPALEDRTPLMLARLMDQAFGGFVAPPLWGAADGGSAIGLSG